MKNVEMKLSTTTAEFNLVEVPAAPYSEMDKFCKNGMICNLTRVRGRERSNSIVEEL